MKRTIEIDDTLHERVNGATEELKDLLLGFLEENSDVDECPDLNDLDRAGQFHEMVDSSVPVYTHEIDTIFYLYGQLVEDAFDNAGIGDRSDSCWPNGWKMAAIYCYIEQECQEWYEKNAKGIFEEWETNRKVDQAENAKDAQAGK